MDSLPVRNVPGIHEVVCMFCLWSWFTGASQHDVAQCPRCRLRAGVDAFVAMVPGEKGCTLVRPHQMARFG